MTQETGTFFDEKGDRRMEEQNRAHWEALRERIAFAEDLPKQPWTVLDWGCHKGGLLQAMEGGEKSMMGVEPLTSVWDTARERVPGIRLFADISQVPTGSVDVLVSHEVLYLVQDLREAMGQVRRVLRSNGVAFIALGSHGENTAWLRWRHRLKELHGHESWVHQPIEILNAGVAVGFHMEVGRLYNKPQASVSYWPAEDGWGEFESVEEMLKHRGWKYAFTCYSK